MAANSATTQTGYSRNTQVVWTNWCNEIRVYVTAQSGPYSGLGLNAEQVREQLADQQQRERERVEKAKRIQVLRDEADKRATALLAQFLNEHQRKQFEKDRFFEVLSRCGTRRYRISRGLAGNVTVFDPQGRAVERLCIHTEPNLPLEDNLLAQKLLLEADEEKFRKTANITRLAA
jgi:hypothetical protein